MSDNHLLDVVRHAMKLMRASDDYESLNLIRVLAEHYMKNSVATPSEEENSAAVVAIGSSFVKSDDMSVRELKVEEARRLRICRICRLDDSPIQISETEIDAFVYDYGDEYAHASCIGRPPTEV